VCGGVGEGGLEHDVNECDATCGRLQTKNPIIRVFGGGELVLALRNILESWVLLEQLRDRIGYHGMYEILDYQSTLDIPMQRAMQRLLSGAR